MQKLDIKTFQDMTVNN